MGRNRKQDVIDEVIDLREPEAKPMWGAPVPCPECNGRGYLDHIDPYREIMFIHCQECFTKYEVSKFDMAFEMPDEAFTF